jgi:hypothetical protein
MLQGGLTPSAVTANVYGKFIDPSVKNDCEVDRCYAHTLLLLAHSMLDDDTILPITRLIVGFMGRCGW